VRAKNAHLTKRNWRAKKRVELLLAQTVKTGQIMVPKSPFASMVPIIPVLHLVAARTPLSSITKISDDRVWGLYQSRRNKR